MDASFHIKQPQKLILVPGILYQEQYAVLQNVTFKLLLVIYCLRLEPLYSRQAVSLETSSRVGTI